MNVFYDLRYFLIFFAMVVGAITVMVQILLKDTGEDYNGIQDFAFFVLALRESVGDYDTQTLVGGNDPNYKILLWILWFLVIIVGNIVFMNFIIAVVGESYENCMEKMVQSIEWAKLEMIEECESLLPEKFIKNENLFPRFIVFRRPSSDQEGAEDSDQNEWQGFVKQMKRHFHKESLLMRAEFEKQKKAIINEMSKKVEAQTLAMEEQKKAIEEKIDESQKKIFERL